MLIISPLVPDETVVRNGKRVAAKPGPEANTGPLWSDAPLWEAVYGGDDRTAAAGTSPLNAAVLCLEKAKDPAQAFAVPYFSE